MICRQILLPILPLHDRHESVPTSRDRARPRSSPSSKGEREHAFLHGRRVARLGGAQARVRADFGDGEGGEGDGDGGVHDVGDVVAGSGEDVEGGVSEGFAFCFVAGIFESLMTDRLFFVAV